MSDEIVEAKVEELETLPAVRSSGMLLAGADTTAKLAHAMEIAKALSDVIDQQKLFAMIGGKKHVLVEGWELLGSLLGVFPVVEWTRKTENGWEARVVAKTLDGAEVGSAEMMCTRDENRWRTADDYAIRSMAQTRAVSKSLRAPLGFVMKLAGYEALPMEEMVRGEPAAPKKFDPETDLLPGAISGSDAPQRLYDALNGFDPTVDWSAVVNEAALDSYGSDDLKKLKPEDYADFWRRLSNTVQWITVRVPAGDLPPIEGEVIVNGFAYGFSGFVVELTYKEAVEKPTGAPLSAEQAEEVVEALEAEDIEF